MKDLFKCVNNGNCTVYDKRKLLQLMECYVKTVHNPRHLKSTEKMIRALKSQLKPAHKKHHRRHKGARFGEDDTRFGEDNTSSTMFNNTETSMMSDSMTDSSLPDTDTSTTSMNDTTSFGQSTGLMVSNKFGEYTRGYGATY